MGIVALGLACRAFTGGAFAQNAGTALYAAMVYAGLFVLAPRWRPATAAIVAAGFCWVVEFAQLSGVPAALSQRSVVARLVLGSAFDARDLLWYVAGVAAIAGAHALTLSVDSGESGSRRGRPG